MNLLNQTFADIREKTDGMNFTQKLSYLWEYYRLQFFTVLFFAVCIISLTGSVVMNSLANPVLKVGILNDIDLYYSGDVEGLLREAFPEAGGFRKPERLSFTSPATENSMYAVVQLASYLSTGEIDCGICDTESLDYIRQADCPLKVTDISDSRLGRKMENYGLSPLYYFYFPDSEHAEAAALFEEFVKR